MASIKSAILAAVQTPRHLDEMTPWGLIRFVCLLGSDYDRLCDKRAKTTSTIKDHAFVTIAVCFDPATNKPIFEDADLEDLCSGRADVARYLAETASRANSVRPLEDESGNAITAG